MDIHIIVKLKSSYEDWHKLFLEDTNSRAKICNENRTLVGKANEKTAVITLFDVDEAAMKGMMEDHSIHIRPSIKRSLLTFASLRL